MANGNNPRDNGSNGRKWRADRPTVRWSQANADHVLEAIDLLTQAGCAVIFNRTSNGADLILGLYAGNERPQDYLQTPSDIEGYMGFLVETYAGEENR